MLRGAMEGMHLEVGLLNVHLMPIVAQQTQVLVSLCVHSYSGEWLQQADVACTRVSSILAYSRLLGLSCAMG